MWLSEALSHDADKTFLVHMQTMTAPSTLHKVAVLPYQNLGCMCLQIHFFTKHLFLWTADLFPYEQSYRWLGYCPLMGANVTASLLNLMLDGKIYKVHTNAVRPPHAYIT